MDRRRLEEAFLQYALLKASDWYPKDLCAGDLFLHERFSPTMIAVTPKLLNAFINFLVMVCFWGGGGGGGVHRHMPEEDDTVPIMEPHD